MSGDGIEAVGQIAEGGLAARAVENEHGEGAAQAATKGHFDESECLSCGAAITGPYCSQCGQKAHLHRTLAAFGHDLMHGVLHLDGKLWRTLPLLMFKPGEITRRYINGERAKFVSPMAMFLFSVFLMFAVFQLAGITTPTNIEQSADLQPDLTQAQANAEQQIDEARASLSELSPDDPERAEAERRLQDLETAAKGIGQLTDVLGQGDNAEVSFNGTGIKSFDDGIIKKWRENPSLMLYKMQNNSYKFSWLLIPISVPFVWVLFFWKRRFKVYDHAIFVTYSLAFMSLLYLTLSVLGIIGVPLQIVILSGIFVPILHIYKQLKYGYELSRRGALWRTISLANMILFGVVFIFLWLLLLLGAL